MNYFLTSTRIGRFIMLIVAAAVLFMLFIYPHNPNMLTPFLIGATITSACLSFTKKMPWF